MAQEHPQQAVRAMVVLLTAACLLVQLVPVAPPRLLPADGMADTAARYGQSVYSTASGLHPNQFSAMPSIHVGWALLAAVVVVQVSGSRWRWLACVYPALTTLAVVVTANHFWLDAIVAAALLGLVLVVLSLRPAYRMSLPRRAAGQVLRPEAAEDSP